MPKTTSRKTPALDPATPAAYAATNALRALFCDVGLTDHPAYPTNALHLRVLTRAGWANVHAEPCKDHVTLFVRFDTPCLARLCGLESNDNTGKWNHHALSSDRKLVSEQVDRLFGSLVPKEEHAVAEAEFFAAVQDKMSTEERREWGRWDDLSPEQKERANNRRSLPVRRTCGALSTDRSTMHGWCASCGTDYAGQSAEQFLTTAGRFILGG